MQNHARLCCLSDLMALACSSGLRGRSSLRSPGRHLGSAGAPVASWRPRGIASAPGCWRMQRSSTALGCSRQSSLLPTSSLTRTSPPSRGSGQSASAWRWVITLQLIMTHSYPFDLMVDSPCTFTPRCGISDRLRLCFSCCRCPNLEQTGHGEMCIDLGV